MPAARSLKPLLKLTLLLFVLFIFYRSFVFPRLFPSSSNLNDEPTALKKLLSPDRGGYEAVRNPGEGGGGEHFKVRGVERVKEVIEREKEKVKVPGKLGREATEKDHEFNEIVKQVPEEVPVWVVAKEQERVEGNDGDWRGRLERAREEESERKRKERLKKLKDEGKGDEEDNFEKEIKVMEERKGQRGDKGGKHRVQKEEGEERPTKVSQDEGEFADDDLLESEEEEPVYHLVDEDDDLDAVQKGDADKRKALSGQRKKGPLIQVGGAGNAAGDKAGVGAGAIGAGVDAVKPKGKDKWQGKGWDQRFAKKGDKEKEKEESEKEGSETEDPSTSTPSEETAPPIDEEASNPAKLLAQHALVARFLQQDISHTGGGTPRQRSQIKFVSPEDEDAAVSEDEPKKGEAIPPPPPPPLERHNLTVCALIPNEQRFLPEWLLYHSLLGVSRFALYDTTLPGTFGGGEIDSLADTMRQEGGGGENAPTVEELKAQVAYANAGREGLDEKGLIRRERVRGLEDWIDKGRVKMSYMKFKNPRASHDVHALMLENCIERFGATSNWLAHLDVDEFLSFNTPLYGSDEPYSSPSTSNSEPTPDHLYPLHDLLSSPAIDSALCVPVPELNYRNLGIKELKRSQGVLETQVHRDVLGEVKESKLTTEERGSLPQKTLIHTAFSSEPGVAFSGPHSCELLATADNSDDGIRDSQGNILASRGGLYHSQNLPIEPLAIAHYVQRDLLDCHSKLSSVSDPLSLLPKGRGSVSCEAHYLPSAAELSSTTWREDPTNEVLKTVPALGSVLEDKRMQRSWAGRAAKEIGEAWRRSTEKGMRRTSKAERERLVSRVLHKVEIITY